MKLNKLFMVFAATAFVACSSDELGDFSANQAPEQDSRLIELDENFAIAGVGVEDATTRTHWDWEDPATKKKLVNKFLPIWKTAPAGLKIADYADLTAQAVGLCWLGQVPGTDVYTNYQFYHFGWLNNGETEAKFDCGNLTNGSLYSDITAATGTATKEAIPGTDWTVAGIPAKSLKAAADNLNYNSGVYKTDNKAIFGGTYIVYYPFNKDFTEAGTIPAKAETLFNKVSEDFDTPELGKATFRYSAPVTIAGGDQAADFGMYNLSSLVQLRVATSATEDLSATHTIDQIVLCSASGKLIKQAYLAADKIVAGKKGAELYDGNEEGTKTIVANFTAPVVLKKTDASPTSAFITVLPTTVSDLKVLVHGKVGGKGKWATIDKANTVFEAGKAKRLDITVTADDFKSEFIAVDDASLRTALTEANAVAAAATPATITVIGDITLGADLFINTATYANSKFINVTGDDIIVPQNVLFRLETNMVSDVRVLGRSCCTGTWGGRLEIQGGTVNNVTMEETEAKVADATDYFKKNPLVTYSGAATVAAGKTFEVQAGTVYVNEAVAHKGAITIAEGANLIVNQDGAGKGDLQFMGSTVVNDGTIEVKKDGKFDMTDANGNASATDGQRMTNNGKFIHNVDAGVGTAVQKMHQNGEYRCRVDEQIKLDNAFLQWTACSVIEMVNTGAYTYDLGKAASITPTAFKHNGEFIDIEVNSGALTTFNNTIDQKNTEIQIRNLTVTKGGLYIDTPERTVLTVKYQPEWTVNGNMVVKATSSLINSKKFNVKGNLTVEKGATATTLTYVGNKQNKGGLAVTGNIAVSDATFTAGGTTAAATDLDAIGITCASFKLAKGATANFGNMTDGGAKAMAVSGEIANPAGCTFNIVGAGQNTAGSVIAWITCSKLTVGGNWGASRPIVE